MHDSHVLRILRQPVLHIYADAEEHADGGRRVPREVEGRGENGEEAENGGEEEEEVIGEGRVNRHELDEKKREAEKDEEDRFEHVQAVEGEG